MNLTTGHPLVTKEKVISSNLKKRSRETGTKIKEMDEMIAQERNAVIYSQFRSNINQREVKQLRTAFRHLDDDDSGSDFAEKVYKLKNQKDIEADKRNLRCNCCKKQFLTPWELTKHEGRCHREDSSWVKVKNNDVFSCTICKKSHDTMDAFKTHLFFTHSDIEVKAKYNRPLEKMIGKHMLKRLREPIL
jgi:hypothetical protein